MVETDASVLGRGALARVVRGVLALLITAALFTAFETVNFFFYFTVLSNIFAAALMVALTVRPEWLATQASWRGAITLYMTITGLVYAILLRPVEADVGLADPWINWVLHSLAPAALLIDWLLFPPERQLERSALVAWLAFPAAFLFVTLVRGPFAEFYPYPFLDPEEVGYPGIAGYSVGILSLFLAVGAFLRWWGNARGQALAVPRAPAAR